jgi:predicted DNA-binding transcriptional regulator YafY
MVRLWIEGSFKDGRSVTSSGGQEGHIYVQKVQRLLQLSQWARESRRMRFEEMCERLDVSAATLKRDLRYLREELGVGLRYDATDRCYVLQAEIPRGAFEVRGVWIHDDDLFALRVAQHVIEESGSEVVATRLGRILSGLQSCRG